MSILNLNIIPCRCGHSKEVHPIVGRYSYMVCNGCFLQNRMNGRKQWNTVDCERYIPDNLIYIEQEAKKRNLI